MVMRNHPTTWSIASVRLGTYTRRSSTTSKYRDCIRPFDNDAGGRYPGGAASQGPLALGNGTTVCPARPVTLLGSRCSRSGVDAPEPSFWSSCGFAHASTSWQGTAPSRLFAA